MDSNKAFRQTESNSVRFDQTEIWMTDPTDKISNWWEIEF